MMLGNVLPKIFQISLKRFRTVFIYIYLSLLNVERRNVKDGVKVKSSTKKMGTQLNPFHTSPIFILKMGKTCLS